MKLGFIGAGRMAEAIIRGLISARAVPKKNIYISDKEPSRLKQVAKKFQLNALETNTDVIEACDTIVLAVKPQVMGSVLTEISGKVRQSQLVISIAAGITLKSLEKYLDKVPVIRVMPNNPSLIGEGISVLCGGKFAAEKDLRSRRIFFLPLATH